MMPIQVIHWIDSFKRIYKETKCPDCSNGFIGNEVCGRCKGSTITNSAEVVEVYDVSLKDGRGKKHFIPAVIRNVRQIKQSYRKLSFSRLNVLRRDNFTCQYCGVKAGEEGVILEMEHVVPRSKWNGSGSPTCWTNIVTACRKCNRKKNDYFLAHSKDHGLESDLHIYMPLFKTINGERLEYRKPKAPKQGDFHLSVDFQNMKKIPDEWRIYIDHLLK
jgi:5-methylcytosine-specific restriction endonuclease McrA